MIEHHISALRQHDDTIVFRAPNIPPGWLEEVAKIWRELDAQSRAIAVSTAARIRNHTAGQFLLTVANMRGEESSVSAASALVDHPNAPEGSLLLNSAETNPNPLVRIQLYKAAANQRAPLSRFEQVSSKDADPSARRAARDAMAKLGHLPSLHVIYAEVVAATANQVLDLYDTLEYVNDKRLAKALIPWLHKLDPVKRLGSDRSPAMIRQADYAVWIANRLNAGVALPVNYIDNYPPGVFSAARPALEALPALPPVN